MKKIILLLVVILSMLSSWAQAPQKMSYQAVIRAVNNTLIVNTTIGIRISILQASSSGTAVYVETQTSNTNANGLVSLEIGTGTVITGIFSTINWANGPYFIKIETDPNGGTNYSIIGTSELMSVPYALFSVNGNPGPQGPIGADGKTILNGTVMPSSSLGANGDFYLNTSTNTLYGPKTSNTWPAIGVSLVGPQGIQGSAGVNGINGKTILNGAVTPSSSLGVNGDFYINTTTNTLYGPKASNVWPVNGVSLVGPQGIQGIAGPQGTAGINGINGLDGKTILNGAVTPSSSLGVNGDFYINTTTNTLYGPKASNTWPVNGVSLVGPQGIQGAVGVQGMAGVNGINGLDGKTILNGTSTPSSTLGFNGDFFINTTTNTLYGPKASNTWPTSGVSLVGPQGPSGGVPGTNGTNGKNTLVKTAVEIAGTNCTAGGVKLEYGLDANNNGLLDSIEINTSLTKYICNGITGVQGPPGIGAFVHYVGEKFGGGIVFHVYRDSLGVEHGLIVSLMDQASYSSLQSWSNITTAMIGNSASSTWNGLTNSNAIIAQSGHTVSAASLCLNLILNGQSDWYLPSIDELLLLSNSKFNVNRALSNTPGAAVLSLFPYWSSTEGSSVTAWDFDFRNNSSFTDMKSYAYCVRAIRAF